MHLDPSIFDRLQAIQWFSNCTRPPDESLGLDVIWIDDWQAASQSFSDPEWENTTLEAQNALTEFLAKKHPNEFQEWNKLVRSAKAKLEETVFPIAEKFAQEQGLGQPFVDCVKWDILGIVMEHTYKSFRRPTLSEMLLKVYEHGRFPCGWKGEWPNGRLTVI